MLSYAISTPEPALQVLNLHISKTISVYNHSSTVDRVGSNPTRGKAPPVVALELAANSVWHNFSTTAAAVAYKWVWELKISITLAGGRCSALCKRPRDILARLSVSRPTLSPRYHGKVEKQMECNPTRISSASRVCATGNTPRCVQRFCGFFTSCVVIMQEAFSSMCACVPLPRHQL